MSVKYSVRVPTHSARNADTARVRMVRGRVIIQDLFNLRLDSLYSGVDSNPIPRWRGDSRSDGLVISSDGAACLFSVQLMGSLIQGVCW